MDLGSNLMTTSFGQPNPNSLGNVAGVTLGAGNVSSYSHFDPQTPPPIHTLVYSPDVKIQIARGNTNYDVSSDIISVATLKVENGASSLQFTLSNKFAKYNSKFLPMDRVTVYMKRIDWVQVFSGYLDSVPFQQMYGGQVMFRATCTLKRLMYTWWDPMLTDSQSLFDQANLLNAISGDGQLGVDTNLGNLLRKLLVKVGGWRDQNIHIQDFPLQFLEFVQKNMTQDQQEAQTQVQAFRRLLLSDDTSLGIGTAAGQNFSTSAPSAYTAGNPADYVAQIIASCDAHGMGPNTVDLNMSHQAAQAAQTGASSNNTDAPTWQQYQDIFTNVNTQARNTDAAILGVACALAESQLRMLANATDPPSLNFPHDGFSTNGSSVGLFQQQNNGAWGTTSQRMNSRQSADMFFNALKRYDWQNMSPGAAIHAVQNNSTGTTPYDSQIAQATSLVSGARGGGNGGPTAIPGAEQRVGTGANLGLTPATGITTTTDAAGNIPGLGGLGPATNSPGPALENSVTGQIGKPVPDAQGAVNWALTQIGTPYFEGNPQIPFVQLDCSGLCQLAYRSINQDIGRTTWQQADNLRHITLASAKPGDMLQSEGGNHTVMMIAPGLVIEAGGPPVLTRPLNPNYDGSYAVLQSPVAWGGPDPTAPFAPNPLLVSPGAAPGTIGSSVMGTAVGAGQTEPIARNLFTYQFVGSHFAPQIDSLFHGERSFMEGQPLMQMVRTVAGSSLRNFASAPNGDFVAYYADFFGLDGTPAVVNLEDIEMVNVQMDFSDDSLATHVYVAGADMDYGQPVTPEGWLQTMGIATVENDWLFQRMRKAAAGGLIGGSGAAIMKRYGARPLFQEFAQIRHGAMEKLLAIQLFMERWAEQYQTSVEFTFMPELFPGMRINLVGHDLQVYVKQVEHQCDWVNGFFTKATIMAPSKPSSLTSLPSAQGLIDTTQSATQNLASQNSDSVFGPGGLSASSMPTPANDGNFFGTGGLSDGSTPSPTPAGGSVFGPSGI